MTESSGPAYPANPGSIKSAAFYQKHEECFKQLSNAITEAFKNHAGDDLLLMDAALAALRDSIREGLIAHGVRIEIDS